MHNDVGKMAVEDAHRQDSLKGASRSGFVRWSSAVFRYAVIINKAPEMCRALRVLSSCNLGLVMVLVFRCVYCVGCVHGISVVLLWRTRAQLLPRMADRTRAVKTTLFTSALRRIFSNR